MSTWVAYLSAGLSAAGAVGLYFLGGQNVACALSLGVLIASGPGWLVLHRTASGRLRRVDWPVGFLLAVADLVAIAVLLRLMVTYQ